MCSSPTTERRPTPTSALTSASRACAPPRPAPTPPPAPGGAGAARDGAEPGLALGHYERFTGVPASKADNITTGRIYLDIITKERRGGHLGGPHHGVPPAHHPPHGL